MGNRKLPKRGKSNEILVEKSLKNKNEVTKNKRSVYMSGCFMTVAAMTFSLLQSGKINDAIYFVAGSFLLFPILYQLAKLIWDE